MSSPVDPTPAKKKPGCLKIAAGAVLAIILIVVLLGACTAIFGDDTTPAPPASNEPGTTAPEAPEPAPAEETVRLVATSDYPGTSTVSWGDIADGSFQTEEFTGTWEKEVATEPGTAYSVTVSPGWEETGTYTVTCELWVGEELADPTSATGTPGGTMATCSEPLF